MGIGLWKIETGLSPPMHLEIRQRRGAKHLLFTLFATATPLMEEAKQPGMGSEERRDERAQGRIILSHRTLEAPGRDRRRRIEDHGVKALTMTGRSLQVRIEVPPNDVTPIDGDTVEGMILMSDEESEALLIDMADPSRLSLRSRDAEASGRCEEIQDAPIPAIVADPLTHGPSVQKEPHMAPRARMDYKMEAALLNSHPLVGHRPDEHPGADRPGGRRVAYPRPGDDPAKGMNVHQRIRPLPLRALEFDGVLKDRTLPHPGDGDAVLALGRPVEDPVDVRIRQRVERPSGAPRRQDDFPHRFAPNPIHALPPDAPLTRLLLRGRLRSGCGGAKQR